MENTHPQKDQLLFAIYLIVLTASPWPLGSNRDWAWPIICFVLIGLALALLFRGAQQMEREVKIMLAAFGVLALWMLIQLTGIPLIMQPITLDQFATRSDLLKTIGYGCFVLCTLSLLISRQRIEIAIYVVVLTALLQALLGAFQLLILEEPHSHGSFVNRNHFAGYLEMSASLGIGLVIARMSSPDEDRWLANLINLVTGPQARLRLILMIIVIGLVLSRSRGGNIAFFSAILVSAGILIVMTRQLSRKTLLLLVSFLVIDAFLIGSYFGVDRVAERVQNTTLATESRDEVNRYSLDMLRDHYLVGTGAGTYKYAFPGYRGEDISSHVTNAENEYLEFPIELGVIGTAPLLVILGAGIYGQVRRLLLEEDQFTRGIAFGCLMGTVSLLFHSLVDFNLQIPSNALLFLCLLSLPMVMKVKET